MISNNLLRKLDLRKLLGVTIGQILVELGNGHVLLSSVDQCLALISVMPWPARHLHLIWSIACFQLSRIV